MGGSVKSTIEFRQAGGSDAQFWSGQNLCFKQAIIRVLMNSVMKIECFFPMMLCLPAKYKNNLEISNFVRNIFYIILYKYNNFVGSYTLENNHINFEIKGCYFFTTITNHIEILQQDIKDKFHDFNNSKRYRLFPIVSLFSFRSRSCSNHPKRSQIVITTYSCPSLLQCNVQ